MIVGAGHAGFQLAVALRQGGYDGQIQMINAEAHLPYQRPPLSKTYLKGDGGADSLMFRPDKFFADQKIELIADRAIAIDRSDRTVQLASNGALRYDHLVLAMGAANRPLTLPGCTAPIAYIRSLEETEQLRQRLPEVRHVAVVGAGFIGLEFAATARAKGLEVDVIEMAPRLMARAVSPEISRYFQAQHEASGVRFHFGTQIRDVACRAGKLGGLTLDNGTTIAADCIVAGIGVIPHVDIARDAGLNAEAGGIIVDEHLLTNDPAISAIGDGVLFPSRHVGGLTRVESVQNATDQARCVASRLLGKAHHYDALPWFWSDQGTDKLQIAGLINGFDAAVIRGEPEKNSFSVFCYRGEQLVAVESVNRAADHVVGRKILSAGGNILREHAADPAFDLRKSAVASA